MAVRKICKLKGCRASPRCEHPWWFDVMYQGKRWRMRVDDFALARGATEPISSKQTAERVWEPKFLGDIISGRDPRLPRRTPEAATELTVTGFLDRYWTNYVEVEGLRSARTIQGHLKALKASLGHQPVMVLEKPGEILRFKAEFRHGHEVATVNRVLGVLRAALNWGRFQDPPLLSTSPFHRFGVTIKSKEETKRDRRVGPQEEQALLAACSTMNSAEHKSVGPAMHDRIIGAIETCCRQGEMLRVQNRDVDWAQHQIVIRGANAKDAENRVNVLACEPWVTVEEIGLRGTFAEFSEDQLNWDPCPPYYWLTEHDAWVHFDAVCECHSKPFGHAGRDSSIFTGSGYTQGDSGSREKAERPRPAHRR